jgi:superfamily II DNA or RNA helicase
MKPTISFNGSAAELSGVPNSTHKKIYDLLSWEDSNVSYQNLRYRNSRWREPEDPTRSAYDPRTHQFPTGLVPRVLVKLKQLGFDPELVKQYVGITPTEPEIPEWAFDHQRQAVRIALQHRRCLIQAPAGSGKTYVLVFLASCFPEAQILVTIHNSDIFRGLYKTFSSYFDEPIGQIGDGKKKWERITIGMQKSLALYAQTNFADRLNKVDVLLGDEVHHFGCGEGSKISLALTKTSYRIGVSATKDRGDGADLLVEGAFGPLALTIPEMEMVKLGVIHAPQAYFLSVPALSLETTAVIEQEHRNNLREGYYRKGVVQNPYRNQLAVDVVLTFLSCSTRSGNALIMVERLEHGLEIQRLLATAGKKVDFIEGTNTSNEVRKAQITALNNQEIDALIATSITDEGVDIPGLELVVNLAGGSSQRAVIQRAGRSGRIDRTGSKTRSLYVDFQDLEPAFLHKNYRNRQQHLNARFPGCSSVITFNKLKTVFNG